MPLLEWLKFRTLTEVHPEPVLVVHTHERYDDLFQVMIGTMQEQKNCPGEYVEIQIHWFCDRATTCIYRELAVPVGYGPENVGMTFFNVDMPTRRHVSVSNEELQRWVNVAKKDFEMLLADRPIKKVQVWDLKRCKAAGFVFGVAITTALLHLF